MYFCKRKMRIYAKKVCNMEIVRDPVAADVPVAVGPTRRMFYFLRMLYRICNPILLSIRIFNPPTLTLLQVFYCDADCKSLY